VSPAFVPRVIPEPDTLERQKRGDLSTIPEEDRPKARSEFCNKNLFIASRNISLKRTPAISRVIEYQRTEAFQTILLARRIFEFGEAHLSYLVSQLRYTWPHLPPIQTSTTRKQAFPLQFNEADLAQVEEDVQNASQGIQNMQDFQDHLGPLWPDDGVVSHELYDAAKAALRELKNKTIARFAGSEADKAEIERLWPFND